MYVPFQNLTHTYDMEFTPAPLHKKQLGPPASSHDNNREGIRCIIVCYNKRSRKTTWF